MKPLPARAVVSALLSACLLNGCAAFKGSRKLDVAPFSENTVGMLGEVQRLNRPLAWVHLRKYRDLPSVVETRKAFQPIRDLMRGIGLYSTQVVAVYQSHLPESEKISALGRYINEHIRPAVASQEGEARFSTAQLDSMVTRIRSSETFLEALGAAQPLANAAVTHGYMSFDTLDDAVSAAVADISGRIEEEFGQEKATAMDLEQLHVNSVQSLAFLGRARNGEPGALDSLRAHDAEAARRLPRGKTPSAREFDETEAYLTQRANTYLSLREQLEPSLERYRGSLAELEDMRTQADERARLARLTLVLWGRSHRNFADGISVKPMIDVMGIMKSTVASGASKIL